MQSSSTCIVCANASPKKMLTNGIAMLECGQCGLVWKEKNDLEADHYEDDPIVLDPQKIEARQRNVEDRIRTMARYTDLNDLCDIGAGEGVFVQSLFQHGYHNVFGIDPNSESVNFAAKNRIPVFKGVLADVASYAKKHPIKAVSMFHVIEHLSRPDDDLRTIHDALPAAGRLIIETPNFAAYSFRASGFRYKLIYDAHLYYFNESNLKRLLERVGFKVIAHGRRDFDQYHLPIGTALQRLGLHAYNDKPVPRWKRLLFAAFGPLLSRFVIMTGRLDYMWFIAEKV